MRRLIDQCCELVGKRHVVYDNPQQFGGNLAQAIAREKMDIFSYTNADFRDVETLPPHRGIHLVRDPRDVLVSAYFSHRNSHGTDGWPELIPHRERLQKLDQESGLMAEIEFSECYLKQMASWEGNHPEIMELKFEEVTQYPCDSMLAAFQHLNMIEVEDVSAVDRFTDAVIAMNQQLRRLSRNRLPVFVRSQRLRADQALTIIHANRFAKLSAGRAVGSEDPNSHYRKGKSGDWMEHFTPRIEQAFADTYPGLLQSLGYE